jgi:hypothetical protein
VFFHLCNDGLLGFVNWVQQPHPKPATCWLRDFSQEITVLDYQPRANWPTKAKRVGNRWVKGCEPWAWKLLVAAIEPACAYAVATNESRNRNLINETHYNSNMVLSGWDGNHQEGINRNLANAVCLMTGEYPESRKEAFRVLALSHCGDTRGKELFQQPSNQVGRKSHRNLKQLRHKARHWGIR